MSSTSELVGLASALLQSSQPEKALELLAPHAEAKQDDVIYLQSFGETLLENNQVETAYQVLARACELDPEALKGIEKFLYFGQIIGGQDGINYIDIGLRRLQEQLDIINGNAEVNDEILIELGKIYQTREEISTYLIKKFNQGIFAEIEIWMTDLCMEEPAESQCDSLINKSIELDSQNPEAWSLLASIRISQQRPEDAKIALSKSWDLFQERKARLEESRENNDNTEGEEEQDGFDVSMEYVELLQPLLTLSKLAIELELYEIAIQSASSCQDINETLLESYYYEGLACLLHAKNLYVSQNSINQDYREFKLPLKKIPEDKSETGLLIQSFIDDSRMALTNGFKLTQSDEENDEEVVEQVNELLNEVGGPIMSELMPKRGGEDEEGWENEIEYD